VSDDLVLETEHGPISAIHDGPAGGPVVVLGHGAGGDMRGALLAAFASGLAEGGVGCLRFNFVYAEQGRRGPDREPLLREAWTAAFARGRELGRPTWAGGKSMGGRIASMMVADGALPAAGLVFVGYPLHPPGKPDRIRDAHLPDIEIPMLFLQGTADPFARWELLEGVVERLGDRATLHRVEGGDHSFRARGQPRDDAARGRQLAAAAARFVLDHP
jgi:predicted alpha/beta-hydrolase family hydrolase